MTKYIKNTQNRKTLVARIGELTGTKLRYTMLGFTYQGQGFIVEREGDLLADENADRSVIDALLAEGLILASERPEDTPRRRGGGNSRA